MKKLLLSVFLIIPLMIFGQEKPVYNIGILTDINNPELIPLLNELKEEITNVVGEDAIIRFPDEYLLANNLDPETAREEYQKLLDSDVDIILAFGLVNNALMLEQESFPKPTILFGSVNSDFLDIDEEDQTTGIENFIYLITSGSYVDDLATFHELTKFNKLGVVVHKPYLKVFPYQELFEREMEKYDAEFKFIEFETYDDIVRQISDIDALYLAEAFYLSKSEISQLAERCIELGLSTFTTNSIDEIEQGILATNQAEENISQFFRRIALTVESYIQGESLANLPVYISFDAKLTLNYNTAEKIGLPLKYSLIAQTDV